MWQHVAELDSGQLLADERRSNPCKVSWSIAAVPPVFKSIGKLINYKSCYPTKQVLRVPIQSTGQMNGLWPYNYAIQAAIICVPEIRI